MEVRFEKYIDGELFSVLKSNKNHRELFLAQSRKLFHNQATLERRQNGCFEIGFTILMLSLILIPILSLSELGGSTFGTVFAIIYACLIILTLLYRTKKLKEIEEKIRVDSNLLVEKAVKSNYYSTVNEKSNKDIYECVLRIVKSMNIPHSSLVILLDSNSHSSNIAVKKENDRFDIYLALTETDIQYFENEPDKFRTICAHRLTQIPQEDYLLWLDRFYPHNLPLGANIGWAQEEDLQEDAKDKTDGGLNSVITELGIESIEEFVDIASSFGTGLLTSYVFKKVKNKARRNAVKAEKVTSLFNSDFGAIAFTGNLEIFELIENSDFQMESVDDLKKETRFSNLNQRLMKSLKMSS